MFIYSIVWFGLVVADSILVCMCEFNRLITSLYICCRHMGGIYMNILKTISGSCVRIR